MESFTIDWKTLDNISYRTQMGKSLKNTLRKFNKTALFEEINQVIDEMYDVRNNIEHPNRIKSEHSCRLKYNRYYPAAQVESVFNDILGIRIIVDDYKAINSIKMPSNVRIVDMRNGKANDDGYRAIHLYYQKSHYHYPIEIQIISTKDRQFNEWLHMYLYKYVSDNNVGKTLREMYDNEFIGTEEDFKKEMQKICVI